MPVTTSKLRKLATVAVEADRPDIGTVLNEAADEIERLEAKLAAANLFAGRTADALNAYLHSIYGTPTATRDKIAAVEAVAP